MVDIIREFSPAKRVLFFSSVMLLLAVFIVTAIWLLVPIQKPLFERMDEQSAAQAIAYLDEAQIPYNVMETANGHAISVSEEQVERLKVTMSSDLGLPKVQGLELFENADYSMTDFTQEVTYKRALQGELARTITVMPGVSSARVHITFAPKKLFSNTQEKAKAAVYLELLEESKLDEAQVNAVQVLVANAVENLEMKNVAVFSDDGLLLTKSGEDSNLKSMDKQLAAKHELEQRLITKAYKLLSLAISPENIAVSVDVILNFDQRKQMVQDYIANAEGEGAIIRKVESEQNQQNNPTHSRKTENVLARESETEYQHGKRTEEVIFSSGEIKVMNVAVALRENLDKKEVATIKELLVAGLGVNSYRGDNIAVAVLKPKISAGKIIPEEIPIIPNDSTLNGTEISTEQKVQVPESWIIQFNAWWLLTLLIIPGAWVFSRRPALNEHEREQLLLEAQQWLNKGDVRNGN